MEIGKRKGGGWYVLFINRWCNPGHITGKEQVCSRDIELLAVGVWPYYFPQEFSHVNVITVYIPPSADRAAACDRIHCAVPTLQT